MTSSETNSHLPNLPERDNPAIREFTQETIIAQVVRQAFQPIGPTLQPNAGELCAIAVADTDFCADLSGRADIPSLCIKSIEHAAELWSERNGDAVIELPQILRARAELEAQAYDMLEDWAEYASQRWQDELQDGIDSGDLDRDGHAVPYPKYRG